MIIIRADCNSIIGIGHLMRCMSIAAQIRRAGRDILFVNSDDQPADLLDKNGYNHLSLGTGYDEMEAELPAFTRIIEKNRPDCILVDSYYVTESYFTELRKYTKVAYIDDMCTVPYPLDLLINYNIHADKKDYLRLYKEKENIPKLIMGLEYVPLREEFAKSAETKAIEPVTDILLSTGGADPLNISMDMAKEWLALKENFKDIKLHIVCGPFYRYNEQIKEKYEKNPNIELHFNVTNMKELMDSCQLAIASTGSTIYELCAMGVPTVSFYFVENQRRVAEAFSAKTPVISAGDYSIDPVTTRNIIFKEIENLVKSDEKRQQVSDRMKQLIDGCGAARIAERLNQ